MSLSLLKSKLVSFVFQPACCICDERLSLNSSKGQHNIDAQICESCFEEVTVDLFDRCSFCGAGINSENPFGERCRCCRDWNSRFQRAIAIGNYNGILKTTIVEIKRDFNEVKAFQVGKLLGSLFDKFDFPRNIDLVVPVPSHWRRRLSRNGFQPSDVMADGLCSVTSLVKSKRTLKSVRFAEKQSKMTPKQRISNIRGAFCTDNRFCIRGMRIVLVDDVMTSGATISECARVLKQAGASSILVAVAARGIGVT